MMNKAGITSKVDDSGVSVGKRYARTDECGIPYAFTIDFETAENNLVTMRQLFSMTQAQMPMDDAVQNLQELISG